MHPEWVGGMTFIPSFTSRLLASYPCTLPRLVRRLVDSLDDACAVLMNKAFVLLMCFMLQAPIGAERFIDMVSSGALDGTVIYRVVRDQAVQFGFIKDETVSRESRGGSVDYKSKCECVCFNVESIQRTASCCASLNGNAQVLC